MTVLNLCRACIDSVPRNCIDSSRHRGWGFWRRRVLAGLIVVFFTFRLVGFRGVKIVRFDALKTKRGVLGLIDGTFFNDFIGSFDFWVYVITPCCPPLWTDNIPWVHFLVWGFCAKLLCPHWNPHWNLPQKLNFFLWSHFIVLPYFLKGATLHKACESWKFLFFFKFQHSSNRFHVFLLCFLVFWRRGGA